MHLDAEPFSVENDLMTPKLSLKRPNLLKHYQKQASADVAAWVVAAWVEGLRLC